VLLARRQPFRRRALLALTSVAALVALTGCSSLPGGSSADDGGSSSQTSSSSTTTIPKPDPTPAVLRTTPKDRAAGVRPDTTVTVAATVGQVTSVTVTDARGDEVPMARQADGSFAATSRLRPSSSYTMVSQTVGPDGTKLTDERIFTTLKPTTIATYGLNYSGMTVGVGMPAIVQFDSAVTDEAYRQAVEKAMRISVSPKQEGSWGWLDNRQLMWRPKDRWVPGTTVRLEAPLSGLQTGPSKWVDNDDSGGFTVGASMVSHVDITRHTMTVTRNGQLIRTMPISAGRNKMPYITRSGTKVIIEKLPSVIMDSATSGIPKGDPEYYREKVDWDLRVTWTGEYLHSAPWSVPSQGRANVSHGCVNLSPANAKWMYDISRPGDIVDFTGSNRPFLPTEGIGVWQYSWSAWQQQSALT
jgi:lipoprotein-anchoring transpeptidase ErfK/SrfK